MERHPLVDWRARVLASMIGTGVTPLSVRSHTELCKKLTVLVGWQRWEDTNLGSSPAAVTPPPPPPLAIPALHPTQLPSAAAIEFT